MALAPGRLIPQSLSRPPPSPGWSLSPPLAPAALPRLTLTVFFFFFPLPPFFLLLRIPHDNKEGTALGRDNKEGTALGRDNEEGTALGRDNEEGTALG